MGGSEQAKCGRVSQAAQEFGEGGLSPKDVVKGGDEEGEVWPQKAGRNTITGAHSDGVRLACSSRDIQGEVVSVRVCGGASN